MLTTLLKTFDTFVFIATRSSSITLSFTGISIGNEQKYEIIMQKKE